MLDVQGLFSGIGGFELGFERAGMRVVGMCERDPFCREWLRQRWPGVPIYSDVRTLNGRAIRHADVLAGGFPCQDISAAGLGVGLAGERSGLWFEMRRIVQEMRPTWVVAENVPALRTRGADIVLGDLEALGYACWPFVVGAHNLGAPHRRNRVWIIARRLADADCDRLRKLEQWLSAGRARGLCDSGKAESRNDGEGMADADRSRSQEAGEFRPRSGESDATGTGEDLADATRRGLRTDGRASRSAGHADQCGAHVADGDSGRREGERLADDDGLERAPRDFADGCSGARPHDLGRSEPRRADCAHMVDADDAGRIEQRRGGAIPPELAAAQRAGDGRAEGLGDAIGERGASRLSTAAARHGEPHQSAVADDRSIRQRWPASPGERQHEWEAARTITNAECRLGISADGLPARMGPTLNRARLKAAGNSIVPDIAELIGRVIVRIG